MAAEESPLGKSGKAPPAFRESFAELGELRSIVREGTPVLALTASAETTHRARVTRLLHMEGAVQVTAGLNRPNVRLGLCTVPDDDLSCLAWIVNMVKEKELSMNPVIVYCQSIVTVGRVFCYFKAELGEHAWVNKDQRHENLLIGMFHSRTLQHNKDRVRKSLNGDGNCRVVVATTASGIGSTFPNVSHVVMYGSPKDVEALVQRVGTAGRHGLQSHAVLYIVRQATRDDTVKDVIAKSTSSCFRQALFSHFEDSPTSVEPGHLCCTFCQSRCVCGGEGCPVPPYELVEDAAASVPARRREVTPEDRQLVRECLEEYMVKLCGKTKSFFIPVELCIGFGKETIAAVVEHCEHIFDIEYILQNLPVFSRKHASEILLIISEVFEDFEYVHTTEPEEVVPVDINYTGYFDAPDEENDP